MRNSNAVRFKLLVVLMVCAVSYAQQAQVPEPVEDATITGRIEGLFLLNEHLSPFNINTTTSKGVVTLTGSVADDIQKELASDLAKSVEGVKEVVNNITVVGTVVSERSQRSWRERVDDSTLTATIRTRLLYNKELKGLKIGVRCEGGTVTLYGVVGNELEKQHIEDVVRETKGVTSVRNELTVQPKEKTDIVTDVARTASDEWVEKRVQAALLVNKYISVRDLNVKVRNGLCILTGIVDSPKQKELAGSLAMSILGVTGVQNDITLYEPPALSPAAPAPATPSATTN
ncbi:MAG: BON domain-containing protein [Candidatus Hydrogenedentes bacterium]|nr:BON domain-containing protein [Candidatus Hydrogenedentota bacterium]